MSYVLYASGHRAPDIHPRAYVPVIPQIDHARAWLSFFLNGEDYTRKGNCLSVGVWTVKSNDLDRLMVEGDGTLTDEERRQILRFKYGTWEEVHTKDDDGTAIAAPRRERVVRAHQPDDYVTIAQLCAASGMPACDARAILRAHDEQKSTWGWAWPPSDVPRIKQLIGIG